MAEPPTEKRVGEQLTLCVPATDAEFRDHLDRGLRRQGYLTSRERNAAERPRKGCKKMSGEDGGIRPGDVNPQTLQYLHAKWGTDDARFRREAAARYGLREKLRDRPIWMPRVDEPVHDTFHDRVVEHERDGQWSPSSPAVDRPLRKAMYRLRDGVRPLQEPRIQACGRAVIAPGGKVAVIAKPDGRVILKGLAHCFNVHVCPTCSMAIMQGRASQIRAAVAQHEQAGPGRVAMMTLTVRHQGGDRLKVLQRKLSRALAAFQRHSKYRRWKAEAGVIGRIRALEVTHGFRNGWHPHFHLLFFFKRRVPMSYIETKSGRRKVWESVHHEGLVDLWQECVQRVFGIAHVPSTERAIAFTMARDGEYIAKMGLELADPGNKTGRKVVKRWEGGQLVEEEHRTPFQIAHDFTEGRHARRATEGTARIVLEENLRRDAALWRVFREDMKGARRIVWSKGLRDRFDVDELTDQELCLDDEAPDAEDVVIGYISNRAWQEIRDRRVGDEPVPHFLMRVAEARGSKGFYEVLHKVAAGILGA